MPPTSPHGVAELQLPRTGFAAQEMANWHLDLCLIVGSRIRRDTQPLTGSGETRI
jgi:hypothetical protein